MIKYKYCYLFKFIIMAQYRKLSKPNVNNFRILVRKAMMLNRDEEKLFFSIPEDVWENIFDTNFNSELTYAEKVILGNVEPIVHTETKYLERVKENIDNFDYASQTLSKYIDGNKKVIFITDNDNDGSVSQAIINQLVKTLPKEKQQNMLVEYARSVGGNNTRGFSYELVDELATNIGLDKNDDFLIVTADNGVNSRQEQVKINQYYPNATLLVTDHHNPEPDMMIVENKNTIMFNPHYFSLELTDKDVLKQRGINPVMTKAKQESYDFFSKNNISGATTIGLLVIEYLRNQNNLDFENMTLEQQLLSFDKNNQNHDYHNEILVVERLSRLSNMIDYVKTAPSDKPYESKEINNALFLQSLLNTNNSVANLIVNFISEDVLTILKNKAEEQQVKDFNIDVFYDENKNIHALNKVSQKLLSQYNTYKSYDLSIRLNLEKETAEENLPQKIILSDLTKINELPFDNKNPNYIEQLRPYIYELSTNDNNTLYETQLLDVMIDVYKKLQTSERKIINELRKIDLLETIELENTTISVLDGDMQHVFNRKLMNKAYNRANNGFNLTLDNIQSNVISGSFRSAFNISDILNSEDKNKLSQKYDVTIETPGHELAAGFIIRANDMNKTINRDILYDVSEHINSKINLLKSQNELILNNNIELVVDLGAIDVIDRINQVVRGNVAHFSRMTPLIKLDNENVVAVDAKTNNQTTLVEQAKNKYGWFALGTQLPSHGSSGKSVLIQNGLLREVVEQNFEPYIRLNYMTEGTFIAEKIVHGINYNPEQIIHLDKNDKREKALIDYYEEQKTLDNENKVVQLSREDLKNNPFFKFNRFGNDDFNKFEEVIIGIIESNNIDQYAVFDVEADGFGNARLLNIGFMIYQIDNDLNNGITQKLSKTQFDDNTYTTVTGKEFLLNTPNKDDILVEINEKKYEELLNEKALSLLTKQGKYYLIHDRHLLDNHDYFTEIKNKKVTDDNEIIINRTLKGETVSYLVKPENFIIPATLSKLTGITNELANKYGYPISDIDVMVSNIFKDKSTLFIAHNTEYDGRIARVNLPQFSKILTSPSNLVADSADFSKQYQLMYDNVQIVQFNDVPALKDYYFYDNKFSKINFTDFIKSNEEGEFPDIKGKIHVVKIRNQDLDDTFTFYTKDLKTSVMTKIVANYIDEKGERKYVGLSELLDNRNQRLSNVPIVSSNGLKAQDIGYKAQGLGETKFIRQMMIHDVDFEKQISFMDNEDYKEFPALEKHKEKLKELQEEYRFNQTPKENIINFLNLYQIYSDFNDSEEMVQFYDQLDLFVDKFLDKNKDIENKYNDTWWYQSVLKHYEPILHNDLNSVNTEIVSTLSGIPQEQVMEAFKKSYDFQQTYKKLGCTSVISDEEHMNGPYKGNVVGDIAYEDKATILLLADRFTNKFGNETKQIVDIFNASQQNYSIKFLKQNVLADYAAMDSMSFKQHEHHKQDSTTIQALADRKENITNNKESDMPIVKFKLSEDYLQDGKHVYAVIRDDIKEPITSQQIEEDAQKIAFIIGCLSLGKNSKDKSVEFVYDDNMEKMKEYKADLMTRYSYIEQNNSIGMTNDYIKAINEFLVEKIDFNKLASNNIFNQPARANASSGLETVGLDLLSGVENILINQLLKTVRGIDNPNIKDDIIQLTKPNQDVQLKTEVGTAIKGLINFCNDVKCMSNDDIQKYFKGVFPKEMTKEKTFENYTAQFMKTVVSSKEFDNHYNYLIAPLNKLSHALLLNSVAIQFKQTHPTRLEHAVMDMRSNTIDLDKKIDLDNIESDNFLSAKHSTITRQKPSKHLLEKMNYINFISANLVTSIPYKLEEWKEKLEEEQKITKITRLKFK